MTRFLTAVIFFAVAGLSCVYTEVEAVKIGYYIQKQEDMKTSMIDRARALTYNIARLKAPGNLERKLAVQKIVLQARKQWRTLVMPDQVRLARESLMKPFVEVPQVAKFFIGTARAEAKETSIR